MPPFLVNTRLRLLIILVLPLMVFGSYISFIASPRYTSTAEVTIKDSAGFSTDSISLPSLLLGAPTAVADAMQMRTFILSSAMLDKLDEELSIRDHYSNPENDFWSRLPVYASREDFLEYFRDRVTVEHSDVAQVTSIMVETFDADYSRQVASVLLREAEAFINDVGNQLATAQLKFLREESQRAALELSEKRREVIQFQKENEVFNPLSESEILVQIQAGIEQELVKSRGKLEYLQGFLRSDAPEVVAAREEVRVIRQQLAREKARLVNQKNEGLNEVLAAFQDLSTQFELATEAYAATLAGVEKAQFEAARQMKYLIRISGPTLPDEVSFPEPMSFMGSVLVVLGLIYGILSMLITIIQEHAE